MTSVAYVTRQPMASGLALLAHWSVRQKLNRVSSVELYVALYAPLNQLFPHCRTDCPRPFAPDPIYWRHETGRCSWVAVCVTCPADRPTPSCAPIRARTDAAVSFARTRSESLPSPRESRFYTDAEKHDYKNKNNFIEIS